MRLEWNGSKKSAAQKSAKSTAKKSAKSIGKKTKAKRYRNYRPRALELSKALSEQLLKDACKKQTLAALRRTTLSDLIGYYDYNEDVDARVKRINREILAQAYQPRAPLQLELSKSDLLVRRLQIPHPDEAIIMTALSNVLEIRLKSLQPCHTAYYGRSDSTPKGIHLLIQLDVYSWFDLWPLYQRQILEFAKQRKLLVITDIQAFFDSLSVEILRRELVVNCGSDELPGFILHLFENYGVKDFYAPSSGRGIPTVESDLPRIVAHCALFALDKFLKSETLNCYTRWVDDVNFGASNKKQARNLIRKSEKLLFRDGLRFGGSKTKILTVEQTSSYIQEHENQYLNSLLNTEIDYPKPDEFSIPVIEFVTRFLKYRRDKNNAPYADKVLRRYYNAFAKRAYYGFELTEKQKKKIFEASLLDYEEREDTRFRVVLIHLWASFLPHALALTRIIRAVSENWSFDDVMASEGFQVLVQATLKPAQARSILKRLEKVEVRATRVGTFYGYANFLAKYGDAFEILAFVQKSYEIWAAHEMCARQVAILAYLLPDSEEKSQIDTLLAGSRMADQISLNAFLRRMSNLSVWNDSLRGSLPPGLKSPRFDLWRAVLSNIILRGDNLEAGARKRLEDGITASVSDPVMRSLAINQLAR